MANQVDTYFLINDNTENGLLEYPEWFDEDEYGDGGYYITTGEFVHHFYESGNYLHVVELSFDDPDFRMVQPKFSVSARVNKLILTECYPLSDINTYLKFNLKFPNYDLIGSRGYLSVIQYKVVNGLTTDGDKFRVLYEAAEHGHLETVKYIIGLGINKRNSDVMCLAARRGHLTIVKYLFEEAPYSDIILDPQSSRLRTEISGKMNIHIYNNYAIRTCLAKDYMDLVCYLIEKGAKINREQIFW